MAKLSASTPPHDFIETAVEEAREAGVRNASFEVADI